MSDPEEPRQGQERGGLSRQGDGPAAGLHPSANLTINLPPMLGPGSQRADIQLTAEHVDRLLEIGSEARERESSLQRTTIFALVGTIISLLVFVFFLCRLFLSYDKPEFIDKILALVVGLFSGGGIGTVIGFTLGKKKQG